MHQLQHALKILGYRMRRYPLWIAVLIAAFPLWVASRWVVESFPWTSSIELDLPYFIRLNDRLWLKHSRFSDSRSATWRRNYDSTSSDDTLIDLEQRSSRRLREYVSIETTSEPWVLQNGILAYKSREKDKSFLIVNPNTFETTLTAVPSLDGEFVDGRFYACRIDKKIYSVDLLSSSTPKQVELPVIKDFIAVEKSPHVIISFDIATLLNELLSKSDLDFIERHDVTIFENIALALMSGLHLNWSFHSLYHVDEAGFHWKTTWLTSIPEYFRPKTSQGLIATAALLGSQIEIRSASTGKIIAKHPLRILGPNGEKSDYGQLGSSGALQYYFPIAKLSLIDPMQPGRTLVPEQSKPLPFYDYDHKSRLYWTAQGLKDRATIFGFEVIEFRDRDSAEIVATWKSNRQPDKSFVFGFGPNSETTAISDDWQRLMVVDMKTGKTLLSVAPYDNWLGTIVVLGVFCCAWFVAYKVSCEMLRLPRFWQYAAPLSILWGLAWIRLKTTGNPAFNERISIQTILAIVSVILTSIAFQIWPRPMRQASHLLATLFAGLAILVLNYKQSRNILDSLETIWFVANGCCALVIFGLTSLCIQNIRRSPESVFAWRFSLPPAIFWLTLVMSVFALLKFTFEGDSIYKIEPWREITRFLVYPMLAISLWNIVHWKKASLLRRTLVVACLISFVTLIRTLVCVRPHTISELEWVIQEEVFYSCCASFPTAILTIVCAMPIPHWLRKRAKLRLNAGILAPKHCARFLGMDRNRS